MWRSLNNATIFYDENNQITDDVKKVKFVYLPKLDITVPVGEVYVKRGDYSIYQDYTTMNKILLDKFCIDFPIDSLINSDNTFINPRIEEVDFSRIDDIVKKTKGYIDESYQLTDTNLNVFNASDVEDFISNISDRFINMLNSNELLNCNGMIFIKNNYN